MIIDLSPGVCELIDITDEQVYDNFALIADIEARLIKESNINTTNQSSTKQLRYHEINKILSEPIEVEVNLVLSNALLIMKYYNNQIRYVCTNLIYRSFFGIIPEYKVLMSEFYNINRMYINLINTIHNIQKSNQSSVWLVDMFNTCIKPTINTFRDIISGLEFYSK